MQIELLEVTWGGDAASLPQASDLNGLFSWPGLEAGKAKESTWRVKMCCFVRGAPEGRYTFGHTQLPFVSRFPP